MTGEGVEPSVPSPRREVAVIVLAWAAVVLLALVARGWQTALATSYMLALVVVLGWGVPRSLGAPRLARVAACVLLALGALLPFQPAAVTPELWAETPAGVAFPTSRARAFQEIAPPADWRDRGEVWAYVGFEGEIAEVLSARPVLAVSGRALAVEKAPERGQFVRARVPRELLAGPSVLVSLGFEEPSERVKLARFVLYEGSLERQPSTWSEDGATPPPGAPRVPRRRGLLGLLGGGARYELAHRWVIELWLLDERGRVVATCY